MLGLPKKDVKPYSYFDTPDGEDVFQKLWAILKPTTLVALGVSTADVLLYSHPQGYLKTFGRYVYISVPILGMSTAFVLATNLSAGVRKTDDKVNWFLGGAAAGGVLGACCKSGVGGTFAALGFGLAALLKKHAVQNNFTIHPTGVKPLEGGVWTASQDWSLIKQRSGNWTTGLEK